MTSINTATPTVLTTAIRTYTYVPALYTHVYDSICDFDGCSSSFSYFDPKADTCQEKDQLCNSLAKEKGCTTGKAYKCSTIVGTYSSLYAQTSYSTYTATPTGTSTKKSSATSTSNSFKSIQLNKRVLLSLVLPAMLVVALH